jgi:hypothetical protein
VLWRENVTGCRCRASLIAHPPVLATSRFSSRAAPRGPGTRVNELWGARSPGFGSRPRVPSAVYPDLEALLRTAYVAFNARDIDAARERDDA